MYRLSSDHREPRRLRRSIPRRQAQRGVTLLFAMITLVALLFATLALVRSVDTSTILMGNIGFKQDATVTADQATRQAIAWLGTNNAVLNTDKVANGYYASTKELGSDGVTITPVDVTGQQLTSAASRQVVDWSDNSCTSATGYICSVSTTTSGSNTARYVVFRMCSIAGDYGAPGYTGACAKPLSSSGTSASKKGELNYADSLRFTSAAGPYYRVVVRVQGVRNTTSFTETIVHF